VGRTGQVKKSSSINIPSQASLLRVHLSNKS